MSEMFSWINNACADSGSTFSTFVSNDSIVAGQDFGRMLGSVSREVHLNEKSMYRLIPWAENAICFRPGTAEGGNQLDDAHGFWSTYAGAVQDQQSKQQSATSKLDSVPATPPLLSDIVTLVSATTDRDKVGQLPNEFATFIDSLPIPYGSSSTGIQGQFSFGANSTLSAAVTETEPSIRPKIEIGNSEAHPKLRALHSVCIEAKDDQVKKILSKCGKWTQSAAANKSLQWTTVGLEKPKVHGRTKGDLSKKTEGPGRQHHKSFRPVPSEKAEHVQRERERRIQLRAMYKTLDTLVPAQSRTAKRDRTTIVNDALNYVKEMRKKLEMLQAYKSKPVMSLALSELIAQNIEKRNNQASQLITSGVRGKTSSPTSNSTVDIEHTEGDIGTDGTAGDTSVVLVTPEVNVFMASSDQVVININCGPRPDLLSRILKALDLLHLDVSHYTFSRLCTQFVNCHFAAKIRTSADTTRLTEIITEVLGDSLV
ncbi:protein MpBHLH30 [Marchantia polymorpha subsp. ruderalis]|uniref:BHLH domain-containing protein n=2 Tax=Marchantia polymorpha TaxID=3197 RepID=A0A176VPE2_MARPO|nr:hypothetical protein AXG93_4170s1270 [Marchantia polymorpha subsp. ruderalis]PTQ45171.1 hypothetical protein MARPO_0015s0001 [Marchantia polymorpha]BBN01401.1 hypothetical protein Mp_2g07130 [Marchantia polymorpha subsp. ruderalis]|eukprot:PTQ45171.1 hypothetical protein MARPO_0015s0001 [Marchantia polymorpha]